MDYYKEGSCIEYFVNEKLSGDQISSSIVLAYNASKHDLHVSRFHPELYLQPHPKYMSAVCFFLIIQHCETAYAMDASCHISLETVPAVCDDFYKKLKDFNFHIERHGLGNVVELVSDADRATIDTSVITEHVYHHGEIPFMK